MNWYKRANQLGLYGQNPEQDVPGPQVKPLFDVNDIPARMPHGTNLIQEIEAAPDLQSALGILDQYGVQYNEVQWPGGANNVYLFEDPNGTEQVLETDGKAVYLNDASQWVHDINDMVLDRYVPMPDFNKEFWNGIRPGSVLYHGTPPQNIPKIKRHGLQPMARTRGLSNNLTGAAVFASENREAATSYGSAVIEIDAAAMKAAGYMPEVGMEEPIIEDKQRETIAWRLGLEDWHAEDRGWEGIADDTVVIYGTVPPQFLRIPT